MKNGDIYVSRTDPDTWEPDTDIGGSAHMLFDHGDTKAGLWKADPDDMRGNVSVEIPSRETIVVLEGSVRVAVDRGAPHNLSVGDMISIPAGAMVGWDPTPHCKVFWMYS
jgi:uncharacterized cupin superfamily protein